VKTPHLVIITMTILIVLQVPVVSFSTQEANTISPQLTIGSFGTGPGQLNLPRGIVVDDSGNIYVADNRNHRMEKFDSSGKFILEFGKGSIPEGIAIDRSGNINVVDRNNMTVEKFTPKGMLLSSFGSAGSAQGQLGNAERIAIDSSGKIYVTDVNVIQKFNSNGKFMSQFFENDTQNCCMNAMGIAIDGSDNVYVADMFYNRILKFNSAGSILLSFNSTLSRQQAMSPQDVAVDNFGNIYVADTGNGRIVKFNSAGSPLSSINISGVPVGIAIDKSGKIYATDLSNNKIDVFSTSQFTNSIINTKSTVPPKNEVPLSQNSTALATAIKLATSSPQFQSIVKGYNYTFSSDFEGSGPLSTGGIGLIAHGFAFELYSGPIIPGKAVKVAEVLEDPTLSKILNVTSYDAVYNGPVIISLTNSTVSNESNNITVPEFPLKQFKSGIVAKNVICNHNLQLIFKAEDGSPACVKPESVSKLLIRGWAKALQ
jgi:streptogramin lyase